MRRPNDTPCRKTRSRHCTADECTRTGLPTTTPTQDRMCARRRAPGPKWLACPRLSRHRREEAGESGEEWKRAVAACPVAEVDSAADPLVAAASAHPVAAVAVVAAVDHFAQTSRPASLLASTPVAVAAAALASKELQMTAAAPATAAQALIASPPPPPPLRSSALQCDPAVSDAVAPGSWAIRQPVA